MAFLKWSTSEGIHAITNAATYRYGRTLFGFLIATSLDREALLASIVAIDPEWQYLTVQDCTAKVDQKRSPIDTRPARPAGIPVESGRKATAGIHLEVVNTLIEDLGEASTHQTSMHRVVSRLVEGNSAEAVLRFVREANGDWARMRQSLRGYFDHAAKDTRTLEQLETQMGAVLTRLQDQARSLRLAPASDLLEPLAFRVRELARQQNKQIELELHGTELKLDRDALSAIARPIQDLVAFAAWHGLEDPSERQSLGKSSSGHIAVKLVKHEDHMRIIQPDASNWIRSSADGGHQMIRVEEQLINIDSLGSETGAEAPSNLVVILESETGQVALPVDELLGRQQVVVRPLEGQLRHSGGNSSCALLGEGQSRGCPEPERMGKE